MNSKGHIFSSLPHAIYLSFRNVSVSRQSQGLPTSTAPWILSLLDHLFAQLLSTHQGHLCHLPLSKPFSLCCGLSVLGTLIRDLWHFSPCALDPSLIEWASHLMVGCEPPWVRAWGLSSACLSVLSMGPGLEQEFGECACSYSSGMWLLISLFQSQLALITWLNHHLIRMKTCLHSCSSLRIYVLHCIFLTANLGI